MDKITFREVEPAEIYLRQVEALRNRVEMLECQNKALKEVARRDGQALCRAREAADKHCDDSSRKYIYEALSSTGPCRHEKDIDLTVAYLAGFHKRDDEVRELKERLLRAKGLVLKMGNYIHKDTHLVHSLKELYESLGGVDK